MSESPRPPIAKSSAEAAQWFDSQARSVGLRWVVLLLGEKAQALQVAGEPGAVLVNPASPTLLEELVAAGAFADGAKDLTAHLGQQAASEGIALRERGLLVESWLHQRVAALVAARLGSADGVKATVANLAVLRDAMREVIERGNVEAPSDKAGQDALRDAAAGLKQDGAYIAAMIKQIPGIEDLRHWLSLHRLACIAGDYDLARQVRECLQGIGEPAAYALAITAAEALAELDPESLLAELSVIDGGRPRVRLVEVRADGQRQESRLTPAPGAGVWALYVANRHRFIDIEHVKDGVCALRAARSQLEYLRLRMTTAGGAAGHEMSYEVARLLQPVGRDLAMLLLRAGKSELALEVAESLLARSMGDWMGRTHGGRVTPPAFSHPMARLTGSLNAGAPATLDEVAACASAAGPLLYLMALPDGHAAWLLRRDGVLIHFRLPGMAEALEASRGLFPSLGGRGGSSGKGEVRHLGSQAAPRQKRAARARLLTRLREALWQPELHSALSDQGEQLVVIADTDFAYVPWAALLSPQGRYVVQDHQIELWPSVTARLLIEAGARVPSWVRARREGPVSPLAMGVSDFSHLELTIDGNEVDLGRLPGVEAEVQRVGQLIAARQVLNRDATLERLFDDGQGAEIVHLASHGLHDARRAELSLLVLGDGILSAGQLYQYDRGLRCGLVVLSACQTGLGQTHPDSMIGLANAFLVAGAQTVVSTLWKVPDAATMRLMEDFYAALSSGLPPAAALRRAQLQALATADREDPFCWAAPVVTGLGSSRFLAAITPERSKAHRES